MKATKTTTSAPTTKKRLFYSGNYYVIDKNNIVFLSGKSLEDIATKHKGLESTDTILFALPISVLDKFVTSNITDITLDFDNKKMSIKGEGKVTLAKCEYEVGEYNLEPDELKEWESIIEDANKLNIKVDVIGIPPIEGTYLEY